MDLPSRSLWWPHRRFEGELDGEVAALWSRAQEQSEAAESEGAAAPLRDLLALRSDFVPALSKLGGIEAEQGRVAEAHSWLERALAADPHYPPALTNKGNLLLTEGDNEGAVRLYRQALAVDPDYPLARHNLAVALKRSGDIGGFVREFKHAQRLEARGRDDRLRRSARRRSGCFTLLVGALLLAGLVALW